MAKSSFPGWVVPALLGVVFGLALGLMMGRTAGAMRPGVTTDQVAVEWGVRPARGPADAAVTIVEFTDYQCPFCRRWHQETYPALIAEYGDRVRYEVRHFPIENAHPFAKAMARAAVCAHRQGEFWAYHERLFEGQFEAPDSGTLEGHAVALQLDSLAFSTCLDSEGSVDMVSGDFLYGVELGVRSTPSFLIGERLLRGAVSLPALKEVLDSLLRGEAQPLG